MSKQLINSGPSSRGWHRIESFLRCPQLYAWRYKSKHLSQDGTATDKLVRGSIGHVGLAHYYRRMMPDEHRNIATGAARYHAPREAMEIVASSFGKLGREMLPIAQLTVEEYMAARAAEVVRVIAVEQEVTTELSDDRGRCCTFTMRPDLIVEIDGRAWIWDHKIVDRLSPSLADRYANSGQFHALQQLGRALYGRDFGGVEINGLQAVVPNGAKFKRIPVPPAPDMLRRFVPNILDAEEQIVRLEAEDRAVDDWPRACSEQVCISPYGKCAAFQLCRFGVPSARE